jgi:Ca2+/H+ antiporter, TMEM165/GDT1 family
MAAQSDLACCRRHFPSRRERAYSTETTQLREQERQHKARLDWVAALASFKAVVLEGLEVVFIVIAVGAGRGLIVSASVGAIAACLLVAGIGFAVHHCVYRKLHPY